MLLSQLFLGGEAAEAEWALAESRGGGRNGREEGG